MLIYEYKLDGTKQQYAAPDEAIRIVQFIRNKCLRLWMDAQGTSKNDLQCYCMGSTSRSRTAVARGQSEAAHRGLSSLADQAGAYRQAG